MGGQPHYCVGFAIGAYHALADHAYKVFLRLYSALHGKHGKSYSFCRHDHFFGNFRTAAGKIRRIDVIIAPAEEQAFCVLGWTGSRQYLRFLRQHVVDLGMNLNSHR